MINITMKQYDYLIIGANLYGAVFAYEAKRRNKTCLVIDRNTVIDGAYAAMIEQKLIDIDVRLNIDYSDFINANPSVANKIIMVDMMDMGDDVVMSMDEIISIALDAVKEEFDPMI